MLHIYFDDDKNIPEYSVTDIESEFDDIKITGTTEERLAIEDIDNGEYLDEYTFKTRLGTVARIQDLSTGCKAVLVALHKTHKPLYLIECGANAVSAILHMCKEGTVVVNGYLKFEVLPFMGGDDAKIDVELDGYRFTTLGRLNYYLSDERGADPNLNIRGIEYVGV